MKLQYFLKLIPSHFFRRIGGIYLGTQILILGSFAFGNTDKTGPSWIPYEPSSSRHCSASLKNQPKRYSLDAETARSLEFSTQLIPIYKPFLKTPEGFSRLTELLHNPLLDDRAIRDRQTAIRWLAENDGVRGHLSSLLEDFNLNNSTKINELLDHLERIHGSDPLKKPGLVHHGLTGTGALTFAAGLSSNSDPSFYNPFDGQGSTALSLLVSQILFGNLAVDQFQRHRLRMIGNHLQTLNEIAQNLSSAPANSLRKIHNYLSVISDKSHQDSLTDVNQSLQQWAPKALEVVGGLTFLSNSWTQLKATKILKKREQIVKLGESLADLDILLAFAEHYKMNSSDLTFPKILDPNEPTYLHIEGGHHPYYFATSDRESIGNNFEIQGSGLPIAIPKFYLLTGSEGGGKSTYLRMIASLSLLAQIGAPVPAREMTLTPVRLFTSIGITDSILKNKSLFQSQTSHMSNIFKSVAHQPRSLVLLDEILGGTNPIAHTGLELGSIDYLMDRNIPTVLATHDRDLSRLRRNSIGFKDIHVSPNPETPYTIQSGPTTHDRALEEAARAGIPHEILEVAQSYMASQAPR